MQHSVTARNESPTLPVVQDGIHQTLTLDLASHKLQEADRRDERDQFDQDILVDEGKTKTSTTHTASGAAAWSNEEVRQTEHELTRQQHETIYHFTVRTSEIQNARRTEQNECHTTQHNTQHTTHNTTQHSTRHITQNTLNTELERR